MIDETLHQKLRNRDVKAFVQSLQDEGWLLIEIVPVKYSDAQSIVYYEKGRKSS